jgi:hypothetical protein
MSAYKAGLIFLYNHILTEHQFMYGLCINTLNIMQKLLMNRKDVEGSSSDPV